MAQTYETLFIFRPDLSEDDIGENIKPVITQIEGDDGVVTSEDRWGKKRLSYIIKKQKYGYYLLLSFECPKGEVIAKIDRIANLSENVLKAMTVKPSASWGISREEEERKPGRTTPVTATPAETATTEAPAETETAEAPAETKTEDVKDGES